MNPMLPALSEPIRLMTDAEPPSADPAARFWTLLVVFVSLSVVSLLATGMLARRRWLVRAPGRWAMVTLAHKLGLSRAQLRLIQHMAQLQGVEPTGLLVSPEALRRAIDATAARTHHAGERQALDRLSGSLLVG